MTIRQRTALTVFLTFAIIAGPLYFLAGNTFDAHTQWITRQIDNGFSSIEISDAKRNVQRFTDAMNEVTEEVKSKGSDWGTWDDAYRFAGDHNQSFIKSNMIETSLSGLNIDLLLIVDNSGKIATSTCMPQTNANGDSLAGLMLNSLGGGTLLVKEAISKPVSCGIIRCGKQVYAFALHSILKSDGSGPSHGVVLMARCFDSNEISDIANRTHLAASATVLDEGAANSFIISLLDTGSCGDQTTIWPQDSSTLSGYTIFRDRYNHPVMLVRIDMTREIYGLAQMTEAEIIHRDSMTKLIFTVVFLISGFILLTIIMLLLEFLIIRRIADLSKGARLIGDSGYFSGRVKVAGHDEISMLSGSVNRMLEALDISHRTLSNRNSAIQLIMDNLPGALLSIDVANLVQEEHSSKAPQFFGRSSIRGEGFADILQLSPEDTAKLYEYLDVMINELLSEDDLVSLNPFPDLSIYYGEGAKEHRRLSLRYVLVRRDGRNANQILVIIDDITSEHLLAKRNEVSERENIQLRAIAEDPELFREFIIETSEIMEGLSPFINAEYLTKPDIDLIFRGAHTIRGLAGGFGLNGLIETTGRLETILTELRSSEAETLDAKELAEALATLHLEFNNLLNSAALLIGDDPCKGLSVRVPLEFINKRIAEVQSIVTTEDETEIRLPYQYKTDLISNLKRLCEVPARRAFSRAIRLVPGIAARLSREVELRLEGADVPVDMMTAFRLNAVLIHLLRNAIDHGIESSDLRELSGKPRIGELVLSVSQEENILTVSVSDDGHGIDRCAIIAKAINLGLLEEGAEPSRSDLLDLIFRPAFSTASGETDISGKGVGLDVVRTVVEKDLLGKVSVEDRPGGGTSFVLKIPSYLPLSS